MNFSKRLTHFRQQAELSQEQLSNILDIPLSTYRGYEYGTRLPATIIPKVCKAFKIDPNEFFTICTSEKEGINKELRALQDLMHVLEAVKKTQEESTKLHFHLQISIQQNAY